MQTATPQVAGQSMAALARSHSPIKSGQYIVVANPGKSSEESYDVAKQEELWDWLVNTLARDDAEKKAFHVV